MKTFWKKEGKTEQKLYGALIGTGLFALAFVAVIFGVGMQKKNILVKEEVQIGDENPVTGPVARTEAEKEDSKEEEKKKETEEKESVKEENKQKEESPMWAAYNGKDKIKWPVSGNVIIPYSMDTTVYFETLDQYQCNPALYIKADQGTEVKAMFGGKVVNLRKDSRYGNLLTIDMGNGYKAQYGQLDHIPYKKGDVIETGSVIGKISEPTDYYALEGSHLYLKMTLQGQPVNPTDYLEP